MRFIRSLLCLWLAFCCAFPSVGFCQEPASYSVFIGRFEAADDDLMGMAGLVRGYIEQGLVRDPSFDALLETDIPDLGELSAELYTDSCPPGQAAGCAFVVAEYAGVDFALAGWVDRMDGTAFVRVSFIDVASGREALTIDIPLETNDSSTLSSGVGALLHAVARGELGAEEDIRELEVDLPEDERDAAMVAAELGSLSEQLGALAVDPSGRVLSRKKYTLEDFAEDYIQEGTKPWEKLGLTPKSYLRYRNSGIDLLAWRQRAAGKRWQLLLRPAVGFVRGPTDGWFYGHYLLDGTRPSLDSPVATYAFESLVTGLGSVLGLDLGFGVLPFAEVQLGWRRISGEYAFQIADEVTGQVFIEKDADLYSQHSTELIVALRLTPQPVADLRPLVEVGFTRWEGSEVEDHILLGELPFPSFGRPTLLGARVGLGAEMRVGPRLDLYGLLPVRLWLVGATSQAEDNSAWMIEERASPPDVGGLALGFEGGLQFRFGGIRLDERHEAPRLDADEEDF